MAYRKKSRVARERMITRSACPRCFVVEPDCDFICELTKCPRVAVPIEKSHAEWEAREPERAK